VVVNDIKKFKVYLLADEYSLIGIGGDEVRKWEKEMVTYNSK